MRSGRSSPAVQPHCAEELANTLNGRPLEIETTPFISHPPRIPFLTALQLLPNVFLMPNGSSSLNAASKRWRPSNEERPRSALQSNAFSGLEDGFESEPPV